jgi:hypothetical protein
MVRIMKAIRSALAALLFLGAAVAAYAQTIAPGDVMGNGTASTHTATDTPLSAVMDKALGPTPGTFALRGSSAWTAATLGTGLGLSGTALNLQPPTLSIIGGVDAINAASHQWLSSIDTSGVPHQSQPAFTDISGSPSATQLSTALPSATSCQPYGGTGAAGAAQAMALGAGLSCTGGTLSATGGLPLNLVNDYGAVCDSSTDNSTALQNAFSAAITLRRALYIPGCALLYNYSTTITIGTVASGSRLVVYGDDQGSSIIRYTGNQDAIDINEPVDAPLTYYLHDFSVFNSTNTPGQSGILSTNVHNPLISNVGFYNQFRCLYFLAGSYAAQLYNITADTCGNMSAGTGTAIVFGPDNSANNAHIVGGHISNSGNAIYIPNGQAMSIFGVDIEGNYGGIEVGGSAGGLQGLLIGGGTYIEGSGLGGNLYFLGSGSTGVSDVELSNLWLGASTGNSWNVNGLIVRNLVTYNYTAYITSGSSATVYNVYSTGTGGLTSYAGTALGIFSPTVVSALPSASSWKGSTITVLDATACTAGSSPTGGGSTVCTEYSNGSNWIH